MHFAARGFSLRWEGREQKGWALQFIGSPFVDSALGDAKEPQSLRQSKWVADQDGGRRLHSRFATETAKEKLLGGAGQQNYFSMPAVWGDVKQQEDKRPWQAKLPSSSRWLTPKVSLNTSSILSMCCPKTRHFVGIGDR